MVIDGGPPPPVAKDSYEPLDKALREVRENVDAGQTPPAVPAHHYQTMSSSNLKRHHSLPHNQHRSADNLVIVARGTGPISSRTRRAQATQGMYPYDAPDEEDELLDEMLNSTHRAMNRLERDGKPSLRQSASNIGISNPYPTPSPSASGRAVLFGDGSEALTPKPLDLNKKSAERKWPTPPYEESEWAAAASASIWAASNRF